MTSTLWKRLLHLLQWVASTRMLVAILVLNLTVVTVYGTIFSWLEGVSFIDGLYWSATTFFTVGYGDIAPKIAVGKLLAFTYYFVSEIGRGLFAASIIGAVLGFATRSKRGVASLHASNLIYIINPVDDQHLIALLKALRRAGDNRPVTLISAQFEECPEVPIELGPMYFVKGNPLDLATYERANIGGCVAAIICAQSLNDTVSDGTTAAIVHLLEGFDAGRVHTVAEVLVENHLRWFALGDGYQLVDRAICEQLALAVRQCAVANVLRLRAQAYDQAKQLEFERCLTELGIEFVLVSEEEEADVEVVFATDLDNPPKSDAAGLVQASDSTARNVIVEYLAVQHSHMFVQWTAFCLDEVVACAVVRRLS